jgi:hypothetical protein
MANMKLMKQESHVEQLLSRIRVAKELGRGKRVAYSLCEYLNSHDAKCSAARRANRQVKLDRRLGKAKLRALAAGLDPWKGTKEDVLVNLKRKPSNPDDFRIYMAFGFENRAVQYLVLRPLEILADLVPACRVTAQIWTRVLYDQQVLVSWAAGRKRSQIAEGFRYHRSTK